MRTIADLHIHSRFARACSPQLVPENIDLWCRIKGLGLVATGDFTHPEWFEQLSEKLEPAGGDLYRLKPALRQSEPRFKERKMSDPVRGSTSNGANVRFICGTELSCIYSEGGATRRVHHLIFAPSLDAVGKIQGALYTRGGKLKSDGRPILGLSSRDLLHIVKEADERCHLIPAHAWTPWFAIFGSKSGYDSIEECFGRDAKEIFAIETGLSSDPAMNWRVKALDRVALISSSDAHSLPNLGREAIVLEGDALNYNNIFTAIRNGSPEARQRGAKGPLELTQTIEFFPEEGMYHFDGHRDHNLRLTPAETRKLKGLCPTCGRPLTVGVLSRVEDLATEPENRVPERAVPYTSLIELDKVIAQALGVKGRASKAVEAEYWRLVSAGGSELQILLDLSLERLKELTTPRIVEAVRRLRAKELKIAPGYDGTYGTVEIFSADENSPQPKLL